MARNIPMTHEGRQALVRLIMDRNHQLWGDARMELPPDPPPPPAPPAPGPPTPPPAPPAPTPPPPPPTPPAPGTFVGEDGEIYHFPADTALANMQPTQVAEYWRHKARKHESTVKQRADYDQLKADSAELARVRQQNETDNEKAVREAREAATAAERAAQAPRLVASEFRAAAKGVLTDAQREALLEDLDLSKYVTANGDVDVEKVGKKVAAFAPSGGAGGTGQFPDLGQGHRDSQSPKGLATGKELFDARRGKASSSST